MSDDAKLRIVLYTLVVLTIIAVIGAWEFFVRPVVLFLIPIIQDTWQSFIGNVASNIR